MIKYLSCPDLHLDPKWPDVNELIGDAIYNAAKEHAVDFIALPGDLFNSHLIATTKGGLPQVIGIVKRWLSVCPVCAIEGTPSHDGQGAYAALEEAGLVLLRPGRMYGYYGQFKKTKIIEYFYAGAPAACLLFGIPELNTTNIHAQLNVAAEQANAAAIEALKIHIESFIAPERARYPGAPAIGLLHGVVSDSAQEFSDDVIVRVSDIVIKTDVLERAGLDRWSLGHIHKPWESSKINAGYAGYAGIDNNPWGKTGFTPGMNLVTIESQFEKTNEADYESGKILIPKQSFYSFGCQIERIPYGTPSRMKVNVMPSTYPLDIAYWIDSDDPDAKLPANVHPWSRVTHRAAKQETRRITREEAAQARTLADLFRLYDPAVTGSVIKKLSTIEETIPPVSTTPIDARLDRVVVKGSIFWGGATMDFNLRDHGDMMLLQGDNGDGKSALCSMLSLYPCVIGKDTKSGRPSAIKDFFSGRDSSIEKFATVNGHQHRHLITLKGAHTDTCTFKGFIYIDDVPTQEDPLSFDAMMAECERLYGPFADYFLTSFYAQPLQGKTSSGLMNATMTDIRDLVQNIAGIDYEPQKRYALDRKAECEDTIKQKRNWIEGAEANIGDEAAIQKELSDVQDAAAHKENELKGLAEKGKESKADVSALAERKRENDFEIERRKADERTSRDIIKKRAQAVIDIDGFLKLSPALPALLKQEAALHERDQVVVENQKLKNAYDSLVLSWNEEYDKIKRKIQNENDEKTALYRHLMNAYETKKSEYEKTITETEGKINALNNPCKNCGWLDPEAKEKIKQLQDEHDVAKLALSRWTPPIKPELAPIPDSIDRPPPTPPTYAPVPDAQGDLADITARIQKAQRASTLIEERKRQIEEYNAELEMLQAKTYRIDPTIDEQHAKAVEALDDLREQYQALAEQKAQADADVASLKRTLDAIRENAAKIEEAHAAVTTAEADLADWSYIASNLQASKLPAMELDIVLDEIDEAATINIAPYRDGVFSFHTVTQQEGRKGAVDRFDILIRNNETGEEKSFIDFSPGMKAFPNDAYVKALIKKRNERLHRHYSPIISDEADGQIKGDHVYTFFEMQQRFFAAAGSQVIVVSQHEKEAAAYIQEHVPVRGLLQKGGDANE